MEFQPDFSNQGSFSESVKSSRVLRSIGYTILVLLAMLIFYLLPNAFTHNTFAIHPREFTLGALIGIMTSWLAHADSQHLLGNMSFMMFPLLYFFLQVRKSSSVLWFALLVFMSGAFTWLLSGPNTAVIGASGVAYALLGFIISGTFKSITGFVMTCLTLFFYLVPAFMGLVPQDHVSWAGHAGGAIAGYLVGRHFNKENSTEDFHYKMSRTDKIKEYFKKLKWKLFPRSKRYQDN